MADASDATVKWLIAGLLIALMCCLCAIILVGAGALFFVPRAEEPVFQDPTPTAGAISPTPVSLPDDDSEIPEGALATEAQLRETLIPIADPVDLAQRLLGLEDVARQLDTEAELVPVGTVQTFWASNVDTNENFQIQAEMVYATEHVYFWVEEGVRYQQADVEALVDEFERDMYPTNREFFGSEWTPGVDNDPHLYIMFARGLGFSIAGYFASNDAYLPEVHEYSNAHEMFYLSADNLDLRDEFTYGVLAHEFQHMIHWYQDRNEETWMNEGFSEVATLLNNYDVGGFDFAYARQTDQILTFWPSEPGQSSAHYGQAFLYLAYFLQRFGPEATQELVSNDENGLDSIDQALAALGEIDPTSGVVATADDIYRDWAVALLLQDRSVGDGRYVLDIYPGSPTAALSESIDSCPLSNLSGEVNQYGIDYVSISCPGKHTITFDGAQLVSVVPSEAHSGEMAFWSNKGDESDMTLTRSFDLTGAEGQVTLSYWVWYDIEEGWDYVYLEVSEDDGDTWTILETPSGTDDDPSGNSYGWAYTGPSGGGSTARWIQEQIDLSQFAGQEIQLRFEYVTDAAVNGEGLLLDDVAIDAIGYAEDFEQDDGGWEAEGFVRLYNRLPQTYRVILIERGRQTLVQELALDGSRLTQTAVEIGGETDEAVLVIIGTTRHTWQPGPYSISID